MSAPGQTTGVLTPADWDYWGAVLGVHNLLPTIWDQSIPAYGDPLPEGQSFAKRPSEIVQKDGSERAKLLHTWSRRDYSERDFLRWKADPRHNIYWNQRDVYSIDIDVEDPATAKLIEDAAHGFAEVWLPKRYRDNSSKSMLLFRVDPATEITRRTMKAGEAGGVEFRGKGCGAVIAGYHPSGAAYRHCWFEGGIPRIALSKLEAFWDWLRAYFNDTKAKPLMISSERPGLMALAAGGYEREDRAVAYLFENGYVRGVGVEGKLFVHCPWKEEHTGDSGESEATYFPHGMKAIGQRGFKCMHTHCEHRQAAQFLEAVGFTQQELENTFIESSVPRPLPVVETLPVAAVVDDIALPVLTSQSLENLILLPKPVFSGQFALRRDSKGKVLHSTANANLILREDLGFLKARYDEFVNNTEVSFDGKPYQPVDDVVINQIAEILEHRWGVEFEKGKVSLAVETAARQNSYDSAQVWLDKQTWDGTARIESFGRDILKATDDIYARALSKYLWVSMAARVMEPGVKVDMAVILISPKQGTGKSTLVSSLVPDQDWFTEVDLSHADEDLVRVMRGKLVLEIAEMRGLSARDSDSTKAFVTKRTDRWVPKYREFEASYHRRSVFIGTTNMVRPLIDSTGNRRWLPIRVAMTARYLDWPKLRTKVEQYWAEAVDMVGKFPTVQAAVEHYAMEADRLAEHARQASLRIDDQMDEAREFLAQQQPGAMITTRALMSGLTMRSNSDSWRAHAILRMLGYQEIDGTNAWRKVLTQDFVL